MIIEEITHYLESEGKAVDQAAIEAGQGRFRYLIESQFMRDRGDTTGKVWPSNVGGQCARKLAYQYHGFERAEVPYRKRMQWFLGGLAELGVLSVMKAAGLDVGLNNEYIPIKVNSKTLNGFIDGMLFYDGKTYVLEVKSKTIYGFKRLQKEGPSNLWGDLTQANLYMSALDVERAVYIGVDRDTGKMCEHLLVYDPDYVALAEQNLAQVTESTPEELPPRFVDLQDLDYHPQLSCYELGTVCSYCDYKQECWPESELEIIGGKPKYRIYTDEVGVEA